MTRKQNERMQAVTIACQDEITRFNAAVSVTPLVIDAPNTLCHGQTVRRMSYGFWLKTGAAYLGSSWCCANDTFWRKLLEQAGVTRNPLFV